MILYRPSHFSRPSTSLSVHLSLFAFSTLFFTVCLLVFSAILIYSSVCFKSGMYVYDIRDKIPFLSGFYAIAHVPARFLSWGKSLYERARSLKVG